MCAYYIAHQFVHQHHLLLSVMPTFALIWVKAPVVLANCLTEHVDGFKKELLGLFMLVGNVTQPPDVLHRRIGSFSVVRFVADTLDLFHDQTTQV